MSQIHYTTLSMKHGPVTVVTGWDVQLQQFHLTVFHVGSDDVVLDDIDLPRPMRSVCDVFRVMMRHGIPVPRRVLKVLFDHRALNLGNVILRIGAEHL